MKRVVLYIALLGAIVGVGALAYNDKDVQRIVAPATPRTTNTTVSPTNTLIAPSFMTAYASAFCAQDAAAVAAGTAIAGITEEDVAVYLAGEGVLCINFRYLGSINDEGQMRYVYAMTFDMGREDWFVFTTDGEMVTSFRRG
jgi:hypothetical protein